MVIFVAVLTECIQGWYGPKCENKCSDSCKNKSCIATTGTCLYGCKPGYIGHNCSESKEQTITITLTIGYMIYSHSEVVQILYKYPLIILECPTYKYGIDCTETCGHCLNNTTCQHTHGTCLQGCDVGYINHYCKTRKWCDLYI